MHARVFKIQCHPDHVDEVVELLENAVLPNTIEQYGFEGYYGLVDRESGEMLSISLWQTESHMKASHASGYLFKQLDKVRPLLTGEAEQSHYEVVLQR